MPDREPTAGNEQSPVGGAATTGPRETSSTERPVPGPISESAALPKYCPQCGDEYDPGLSFCPKDGNVLQVRHGEHSLVGQIIGRHYRILELLGEGGMGQVFLAEHVRIGRRCAIKVMRPALVRDPGAVGRFGREAMTAGRINHRNAVAVYDFGETDDGLIYIVMEHVEGEALSRRLAREGALPPPVAVRIGLQITDALVAAHRLGIIHRDLKPDNILVGRDDEGAEVVKVVDFGIAKAVNDDSQTALTKTGFVLGTLQYMSPEQLIGEPLDGRSDIYSLGCIVFEMLTGERTFAGPSGPAVVVRRLTEPAPTARSRNPDVPEVLDAIVTKALARAAADRFQSAEELKAALLASQGLWGSRTAPMPPAVTTASSLPATPATPIATDAPPAAPVHDEAAPSAAMSDDVANEGAPAPVEIAPPPMAAADDLRTPASGEVAATVESAEAASTAAETVVTQPATSPTPSGPQQVLESASFSEPALAAPAASPAFEPAPPVRRSRRRLVLVAVSLAVVAAAAVGVARAVHRPSTVATSGTASVTSTPVTEAPAPPRVVSAGPGPAGSNAAPPNSADPTTSAGGPTGSKAAAASAGSATPTEKRVAASSPRPLPPGPVATATVRVLGPLPAGAIVLLDGHLTPGTIVTTTPGQHTVTVVASGFEPARWTGLLRAGNTYPWQVTLRPLQAPAAPVPAGTPVGQAANGATSSGVPAVTAPPASPPAAPPGAAATQPSAAAVSDEALRAGLAAQGRRAADELAGAIASRDAGALRRAWPDMPADAARRWREFLVSPDNREISARVVALRPPVLENGAGSVPFSVSVEFSNRVSGRGAAVSKFTAVFARRGSEWALTGIRTGW